MAGRGQVSLATYGGPDRMDRIAAAAKKEGALTLYTTIAEKDLPDPREAVRDEVRSQGHGVARGDGPGAAAYGRGSLREER